MTIEYLLLDRPNPYDPHFYDGRLNPSPPLEVVALGGPEAVPNVDWRPESVSHEGA